MTAISYYAPQVMVLVLLMLNAIIAIKEHHPNVLYTLIGTLLLVLVLAWGGFF
jgi:hypothetical protein